MSKGKPDKPVGDDRLPERLTDAELEALGSEMAESFGADEKGVFFGTFDGSLPPEVVDALRDELRRMTALAGKVPDGVVPPELEAFLDTHDRMRHVVGDLRETTDENGDR